MTTPGHLFDPGKRYICMCGATITFEPPATVCKCGRVHTNWVVVVRLPRSKYRVQASDDGWDVLVPDDGGAFT